MKNHFAMHGEPDPYIYLEDTILVCMQPPPDLKHFMLSQDLEG